MIPSRLINSAPAATADSESSIGLFLYLLTFIVFFLQMSAGLSYAQAIPSHIAKRDKFFDIEAAGNNIWIVGFPGIILHSKDGGNSFEAQSGGLNEALFAVDFIDRWNGWISGRKGTILKTDDGGKRWQKLQSGTEEPLLDIKFTDKDNGWVVGNFGTILHTQDGGKTWTKQIPAEETDATLNSVFFRDANNGWIAGEFGLILHTTNGGTTWEKQESGTSLMLFSIFLYDDSNGWACGQEGLVLRTSDAGESWQTVQTGVDTNLLDIYSDGELTFAAGLEGTLLKKEGESGFTRVATGTYKWLNSVIFDDKRVISVGGSRTILISTDRGRNFTNKQ